MAQKFQKPFEPVPIRDVLLWSKHIESQVVPSLPSALDDLKRLYYYMLKLGLNDFNDLECYFSAVRKEKFPSAISQKALADLLESECKTQNLIPEYPALEGQRDKKKDTKKNPRKRAKTGPRNLKELTRFDTVLNSPRNKDRTKKELALEFTDQNELKAKALLKRYARNKDQGRLG